jgi:hypothetical protein
MKNILTLVLLFIAIPSSAEIISHNLTGTAADIHVSQSYQESIGSGQVLVKLCSNCSSYKLIITSETLFSRDGSPIKLAMLETYLDAKRNAPMRLQFNKNTNQVVYINLRNTSKEYPE